jgi:hypothetical protein
LNDCGIKALYRNLCPSLVLAATFFIAAIRRLIAADIAEHLEDDDRGTVVIARLPRHSSLLRGGGRIGGIASAPVFGPGTVGIPIVVPCTWTLKALAWVRHVALATIQKRGRYVMPAAVRLDKALHLVVVLCRQHRARHIVFTSS